jgi:hypothetical protein
VQKEHIRKKCGCEEEKKKECKNEINVQLKILIN